MATVRLSPLFNGWQGFGNTGLPLAGGKLYTYQAGTGIPALSYTTSAGTVLNSFPITLNSAGRPPQEIWLVEGQAYMFVLADSALNVLATYDNIVGIGDFLAGTPSVTFGGVATFGGGVVMGAGLVFTGVGQYRLKGDFSNATIANRLNFQTSIGNGNTDIVLLPDGTSTQSSINVFNNTDPANSGYGHIAISNGEFSIQSSRTGFGPTLPMTFYCGNSGAAETMRLNTSGQVLIGTAVAAGAGVQLRVAGLVQVDNAAAFFATRSAAVAVNNITFTQIAFDQTSFNQGSYFNTANGRYVPPAGKYALMVNAGNTGAVDQARWLVMIYKNGAVIASFNTAASGVAAQNAHVAVVVDATGADYFEGYVWQNSGGGYTLSNTAQDTYFCGYRVG